MKAMVAASRPSQHFISLESQPEVRYEQGAKAQATQVFLYYKQAKKQVMQRQYEDFLKPAIVHVTASVDSYERYCLSRKTSGCVLSNRLFLSPQLFRQDKEVYPILVHELSHLQFDQYVGKTNSQFKVPSWFVEGLATWVSDGGGATGVSREEARAALRAGKHMTPNDKGGLVKKRAGDFLLAGNMFYRQSSLFVGWLHDTDVQKFQQLLYGLRQGNTVTKAMQYSYGFGVSKAWQQFLESI